MVKFVILWWCRTRECFLSLGGLAVATRSEQETHSFMPRVVGNVISMGLLSTSLPSQSGIYCMHLLRATPRRLRIYFVLADCRLHAHITGIVIMDPLHLVGKSQACLRTTIFSTAAHIQPRSRPTTVACIRWPSI